MVYSSSVSAHDDHLKQLSNVLVNSCCVSNKAKCQFGYPQIDYLGYVSLGQGVKNKATHALSRFYDEGELFTMVSYRTRLNGAKLLQDVSI